MSLSPKNNASQIGLIEAITSPLGFFVLALLIVEAFLASAVIEGRMDFHQKLEIAYIGTGLFLIVVSMVFILVWFKPEHFIFDRNAHMRKLGIIPSDTPEAMEGPKKKKNRNVPKKKQKITAMPKENGGI